jgi:hypothetical protein
MRNRLVAAIRRSNAEIVWVEATRAVPAHYEVKGVTEVVYDFGDNRPTICTHHPEQGESIGLSGTKAGEWTLDCPSPFRPDCERTLVILPEAA